MTAEDAVARCFELLRKAGFVRFGLTPAGPWASSLVELRQQTASVLANDPRGVRALEVLLETELGGVGALTDVHARLVRIRALSGGVVQLDDVDLIRGLQQPLPSEWGSIDSRDRSRACIGSLGRALQ